MAIEIESANLAGFLTKTGDLFFDSRDYRRARAAYSLAAKAHEGASEARNNLGRIALREGRYDDAGRHFREALRVAPDYKTLINLATVELCKRRYDEASLLARRAIEQGRSLDCLDPEPYYLLALVHREREESDEEIAALNEGIALFPGSAELHEARSAWNLLHGRWAEGWADYERRRSRIDSFVELDEIEEWDGAPPVCREGDSRGPVTLLITGERSAGDQIMFSRYVPEVMRRNPGARVVFYTRPELARFFDGPGASIITSGPELKALLDEARGPVLRASLLSLPHLLRESAPVACARHRAKRSDVRRLAEMIPASDGLRVGLCWQSGRARAVGQNSRMSLSDLEPLLAVPGCDFYSLQSEGGGSRGAMFDLAARCHDLADTAAAIENLDLVITVDSAVAHLAGALGKRVWLLCARPWDWRWGLEGEAARWYRSMRLFRQSRAGRWDDVIEAAAAALGDAARDGSLRRSAGAARAHGECVSLKASRPCRHGRMTFYHTDHWIGRSLDLYGEYSEGEVSLFREILKPGDVVVEAGANIGALTVPIARIVGGSGRVHAFEPQQDIFDMLASNVASLPNVELWRRALAADRCAVEYANGERGVVCNTGGCELITREARGSGASDSAATLDELLSDSRVDLIKADVEGMELDVLRGAERIVSRFRPLLYLEDDRPKKSGALHSWLTAHGYRVYRHTPPMYNPENWRGYRANVFGHTVSFNLLCVPDNRYDLRHVTDALQRVRA